jgi:hypothetical protein
MCYEIESNATSLFPNQIPKDKTAFQTMLNSLTLLPCLMIPQKQIANVCHTIFEALYNKQLNAGVWLKMHL